MATIVARLEAILSANTRDFDRGMDKSHATMGKVGKAAGVAGLAIAGGLAVGLEKSVHAAMNAQVANARLDQAFKASHISAIKYAKAVDVLESSGRKLGFTDEQTKDALGSLLVATHSMKKATADLSVSQDIARFKHVDLTTATKMLTMAQAGSQRATKQLGLTVAASTVHADAVTLAYKKQKEAFDQATPSMSKLSAAQKQHIFNTKDDAEVQYKAALAVARLNDKQVTSAKVIDLVRQKLGGQADTYSKTAAGGMEQFHAQLDHLEVKMGTGLLPVMGKMATALSTLVDWFSKHNTVAKITIGVVGALGAAFLLASVYAKAEASALMTKVVPALIRTTAVQWALNVAMTANPVGIVIVALVALGVAMVVAYYKVKFFRDGVNAAFSWIKEHWPLLVGIMGGPIGLAVVEIIKHRNKLLDIFRNLPGQIAAVFTAGAELVKNAVVGLFHKVIGWVKGALGISSPSKVFYEIGRNSIMGFIHGVGSMAGALKNYVVHTATHAVSAVGGAVGGAAGAVFGRGGNQRPVYGSGGLVPQVANAVSYARQHGWHGRVTSGYRTYAEQARLYDNYLHHGGPLAAKPGTSSHETGQAVDVTDYVTFGRIMAHAPAFERLYNRLGAADPVHFSVSGYAKGGLVPGPVGMPQLAVVHGGETVTPPGRGGNTYNTFNFPNHIGSQNELAGQIFDVLQAYENRNGRPYGGGF